MKMQHNLGNKTKCNHNQLFSPLHDQPRRRQIQVIRGTWLSDHTSQSDKLILLRDFNTQIGTDHQTWPRNSWKPWNLKVLYQCATPTKAVRLTRSSLGQYHVLSTNPQKKKSWMHPLSKHWHLIDDVIVRAKDIQDVRRRLLDGSLPHYSQMELLQRNDHMARKWRN